MGYLGRDRQTGKMCSCTCDALRYFQKCYGLKDTGEADAETLELLQRPGCGIADLQHIKLVSHFYFYPILISKKNNSF